jgi:hypothetical protein
MKYISGKYNPYAPRLSLAKIRIGLNVARKTEVLRGKSTTLYAGPDANNKIRQVEAMLSLDAGDPSVVKAKKFIAVSKNDHTVTPGPALEFAHEIGVAPFIFDGPCGHSIHLCPDNGMNQAILKFLE